MLLFTPQIAALYCLDGCSLNGCFKPLFFTKLPWENQMPEHLFIHLFIFFECLGIQFFSSLTCYLWDTMPCQRSPTLLPREAEDFPRGGNHSKHMPLLTCLASLQPICYKS